MKVVVSCDGIIDRDYYLEAVEAALDVIGEQCELYTLVHNHGAIVGPVEARKVHSSFLTNNTKGWKQFLSNSFLIPSASKNLFIPCSVDLVINISRGFSSGIKRCETTKQVTYLLEDLSLKNGKKSLKEKIFSLFLTSFKRKSLEKSDTLWVSRDSFLPKGYKGNFEVVSPPVKLADYKILPDALFQRDYIVINVETMNEAEVRTLILNLEKEKVKFKFVGKDEHLEGLKTLHESYFFGNKCSGEMAPLLSGCKYLIDPDKSGIPIWALRTMASGRPVFSNGNPFVNFGEGFFEIPGEFHKDFKVPEFDKTKVRGRALGFEELKFKHFLKRFLEQS